MVNAKEAAAETECVPLENVFAILAIMELIARMANS